MKVPLPRNLFLHKGLNALCNKPRHHQSKCYNMLFEKFKSHVNKLVSESITIEIRF